MNANAHPPTTRGGGFTLLEMTIVILVLLSLVGMVSFSTGAINDWQAGRTASETLRSAYVAQRTYLADHPTTPVSSLTQANLLPYLPMERATFPQIEGLDGTMRNIKVDVSPPVIVDGAGVVYDPSGKDNDSLWDVGE
jgi:type II secretory pathway pseudopilin PulG